jgi:hypothetical protein
LQLAVHPQRPRLEVYVRPLQTQRLAHPKPARQRQYVKGFVFLTAGGIQEPPRLLGVKGRDLFMGTLGGSALAAGLRAIIYSNGRKH